MKAVTCLIGMCLLAGLVSADFAWESGKQYRYKVRGRVMAGISEIAQQYAGLQLEYIQVITPIGGGVINIKTENLKAIEVNEEIELGWARGVLKNGQEASIPSELKQYLTSPMEVELQRGVVTSIKVQGNLPTWAVNIKKAMASVWTLDTTGKNVLLEGNLNRETNSARPQEANQESGFFFETVEETVHGECETYYTVSQNGPFDAPFPVQREARRGSSESAEHPGKYQHQNAVYKKFNKRFGASSSSSSEESSSSSEEKPWPRAFSKLCDDNDQIYEIVKTVNFTACAEKPVLAYTTPSELKFRPGDNAGGNLWGRALVSRYLACGTSRRNYTILKVTQQERIYTGLRNTEKIIAGAQKNVTLLSIGEGQPTSVQNPKTINTLVYTFDPKEQELKKDGQILHASIDGTSSSEEVSTRRYTDSREQGYQSDSPARSAAKKLRGSRRGASSEEVRGPKYVTKAEGKGFLKQPSLDEAPLSSMLITPLKRDGLKQRVHELMEEVVRDLYQATEKDSVADRETLSKISTVVKTLRVLNTPGIEEVARKWIQSGDEQQEIGRSIFLDALAITGTNPAVNFLFKLIKNGQLEGEEAAQTLATIPMNIRTPTKELLDVYFSLIEHDTVKRQEQLRTTAMLSFTNLAYQACVNKAVKNSRFPVAIYGEFCDEQLVAKKYVPFFIEKLEKRLQSNTEQDRHWIITLLASLGNLGHPDVIEVVQKIMDEETDPLIKVKAVFALSRLVISRSYLNVPKQEKTVVPVDRRSYDVLTDQVIEKQVLPLLVSVAFDHGEHSEVRNAAFQLLFHCTYADVAIWQQIAMGTWFETDREVHSFVYTTIRNLAELKTPLPAQYPYVRKARHVYMMMKPLDASAAHGHNVFDSEWFGPVNTGYASHLSWFQSEDSVFPSYIYYRNFYTFGNGAAKVMPIEVAFGGNTIHKLFTAFMDVVNQEPKEDLKSHEQMRQIRQLLNIEPREQDTPVTGSLYLNIREEIQRLWTFDDQTVEKLAEQLLQYAAEGNNGVYNVNYQKFLHLAEHMSTMPTIMGIPLVYHLRVPALVSIRGAIKFDNPRQTPEMTLQADLSPVYAWKVHRKISMKVPFTGKKYQAGVQRHFVLEAPFTAVARKAPQGQYQIAITPNHLSEGGPSGTIDFLTYHQKPYTAIIHDEFYPTVSGKGGNMQLVRAVSQEKDQYENTYSFGEKFLGMKWQVEEKSDFPEESEKLSGWAKFVSRFHSTGCALSAGWLGSPSLRYVERKVVLNLGESETKTLVLNVAGRLDKTITVAKKLQSSEETESQEQGLKKRSGVKTGSQSSSSSSSSESAEGKQWFNFIRSSNKKHQRPVEKKIRRGSQYSGESSEETQGQKRGHNFVVALLGKKSPLESLDELKSEVQKPLQKGSANTVQYFLHIAQNPLGKLWFRVALGEAANEAVDSLSTLERFRAIRDAVVEGSNSKYQPGACFEFAGAIDTPKKASRHIVAIRREALLQDTLSVKLTGKVQAGRTCRSMPLYVQIQGKLRRDQEMTEWAREKSPMAKRCIRDERRGFTVSQVCMDVAEQQAAALNEWTLKLQHSDMPVQFWNATQHIENFFRVVLFPYMSDNQYPESKPVSDNTIELYGRMTPNKKFVTFEIRKPGSIMSFRGIKTNRLARFVLPPTATQTVFENIKDRVFRAQSNAMCSLENKYVNTFDNVTYSFNQSAISGCEHVLVKDCSGRYPVAVLANDLDQNSGRVITILLGGETKIKLIPRGTPRSGKAQRVHGGRYFSSPKNPTQQSGELSMGNQEIRVEINDKEVQLPAIVPSPLRTEGNTEQYPIAEIMEMPNGGVQVIARRVQVATDGERVIVYGDHTLRNRTCGICGDFNGQKTGEMRSPKDLPLSSGTLLVASYAIQPLDGDSSTQCQVNQQIQRQIVKEEQSGEQEDRYIPNIHQRGQNYAEEQQQRRVKQAQWRKEQAKRMGYTSSSSSEEKTPKYGRRHQSQETHSQERPSVAGYPTRKQTQEARRVKSTQERRNLKTGRQSQSQESREMTSSEETRMSKEHVVFQQAALQHPTRHNQMCFTVNKIATCERGFQPKKFSQKGLKVHCMELGPKADQVKEQIRNGQLYDFSTKLIEEIPVKVAKKCIAA